MSCNFTIFHEVISQASFIYVLSYSENNNMRQLILLIKASFSDVAFNLFMCNNRKYIWFATLEDFEKQ